MDQPAAEIAFWNLVATARLDQGVGAEEQRVLNAQVVKLGLDPDRARQIQKEAEAERPPRIRIPKDGPGLLSTLRAVLEVIAADGSIAPRELAVVRALAERLPLNAATVDHLVKAALTGSAKKLDLAFAALSPPAGEAGIDFAEVPRPRRDPPRPLEALRSLPFAARLASRFRTCPACGLTFANQDSYAGYCRDCRIHEKICELSGGRIETLAGALFVLFLLPVGYMVENFCGLWSWGWEMLTAPRPLHAYSSRRGGWIYLVPFAALTALVAWLAACLVAYVITSAFRAAKSGPRA